MKIKQKKNLKKYNKNNKKKKRKNVDFGCNIIPFINKQVSISDLAFDRSVRMSAIAIGVRYLKFLHILYRCLEE